MNKNLKAKLIDALLRCLTIQDRESRDTVVNELRDEIRHNIKRHSRARVDLLQIVNTCLNYHHGIEDLIESVRLIEGPSIPMQEVEEVWSRFSLIPVATEDQRATLFAIASNAKLADEVLANLYRATLPAEFSVRSQANTLWSCLEHLWDIPPQPDGTRPILAFVERLAYYIDQPDVASRLRSWTEQIAPSFELTPADIKQMRAQIESETRQIKNQGDDNDSYLLVTLMPEGQNRNQDEQESFQVQLSLWKNKEQITNWYHENIFHSLDKIRPLIDDVMSNQRERPKRIEFFLPYELIAHDVDQWEMQQKVPIKMTFGYQYEVVVRSVDRLSGLNQQFLKLWEDKWQLFEELLQAPCDAHLFWIGTQGEYSPESLLYLLDSKEKICLGLTFIPQKEEVFGAMLLSGIPVALWSRASDQISVEAEDVDAKMKAMLSNQTQSDLPRLVKAERRQAYAEKDKSHLGNHLTLFWDDPNRIPPQFQSRLGLP